MELQDIKKQLNSVSTTVNEIRSVLIGNEHDKESGFLNRVKDLEAAVERLEKFKDRLIYAVIGMGIPTSYGIFKIFSTILNILK